MEANALQAGASRSQHVLRWREARDRGRSDLVRGCPAPWWLNALAKEFDRLRLLFTPPALLGLEHGSWTRTAAAVVEEGDISQEKVVPRLDERRGSGVTLLWHAAHISR